MYKFSQVEQKYALMWYHLTFGNVWSLSKFQKDLFALLLQTLYFQIAIDMEEVANYNAERFYVLYMKPCPPVITYRATVDQTQGIYFGPVWLSGIDLIWDLWIFHTLVCGWIFVCMVLCNFITCIVLCRQHSKQTVTRHPLTTTPPTHSGHAQILGNHHIFLCPIIVKVHF